MDVSSTFVATVTPPPFQKGAEEARHDAKIREIVPATNQANTSAKNGKVADERGNTEGQNSFLHNVSTLADSAIAVHQKNSDQKDKREQQSDKEDKEKKESNKNVYINNDTKLFISPSYASRRYSARLEDGNKDTHDDKFSLYFKISNAIAKRYASILPFYDRGKIITLEI